MPASPFNRSLTSFSLGLFDAPLVDLAHRDRASSRSGCAPRPPVGLP
jgi:hypothetical protein